MVAPRTFSKRMAVGAILISILLLVGLAVSLETRREGSDMQEAPQFAENGAAGVERAHPFMDQPTAHTQEQGSDVDQTRTTLTAPEARPVESARVVTGRVRALDTRAPLAAQVQHGTLKETCLVADGSFSMTLPTEADQVAVRHSGYVTQLVDFPGGEKGAAQVWMVPEWTAQILVCDELGAAQEGAQVFVVGGWRGEPVSLAGEWSSLIGESSETGELSVPLSDRAILYATIDGRSSELVEYIQRGESPTRIVVPSTKASALALRLESGAAAAELSLLLRPLHHPPIADLQVSTSADGRCDVLLPLGVYEVFAAQRSVEFLDERLGRLPPAARHVLGSMGTSVRLTIKADASTSWYTVRTVEARQLLVVDEEGNRVRPFRAWEEKHNKAHIGREPESAWRVVQSHGSMTIRDDLLSLSLFNERALGTKDYRIGVGALGFETNYLTSLPSSPSGQPGKVVLRRHREPREIRVLDSTGAPYSGRLRLESATSGIVIQDGDPDSVSGTLGPFFFNGPEALLLSRSLAGKLIRCGKLEFKDFEGGDVPTVMIDDSASVRLIVGLDGPNELTLINGKRQEFRGARTDDSLLFEGLPPGDFAVVSPTSRAAFIRALGDLDLNLSRLRRDELFLLHLEPNEHELLVLPEDLQPKSFSGRVVVPDDLTDQIYLYPIQAGGGLPRRARRSDARMRLPADGQYCFEGVAPGPARLAVVRVDQGGWYVPLGRFSPGEDYELEGSVLTVIATGLEWYYAQVSFSFAGARRFATACAQGKEWISLGWFPAGKVNVQIIDRENRFVVRDLVLEHGEAASWEVPADLATREGSWKTPPEGSGFSR